MQSQDDADRLAAAELERAAELAQEQRGRWFIVGIPENVRYVAVEFTHRGPQPAIVLAEDIGQLRAQIGDGEPA